MRLADLVLAFPIVILAMVVAAALGASLVNAVLAALVVSWPAYARVTRGLVLGVRTAEYVLADRLLGFSAMRSLRTDILPMVVGPVLVLASLDIGTATAAALGSVVPRPRGEAAHRRVGVDGVHRGAELRLVVDGRVPRPGDLDRRDGVQLPR